MTELPCVYIAALACLAEHFLNRFRMLGNHCKEYTCRRIWARPALLPIAKRRWRKTKLRGELRLA